MEIKKDIIEDVLPKIVEASKLSETIEVSQLPSSIAQTFNAIEKLDKNIQQAQKSANSARSLATETKNKSAGRSFIGDKKKEAIEHLQIVVGEIASAQCEAVNAQSVIFENNKKMAESIRYLFGLGMMNIAANRTVVRELELRLRNATENELSELARQELISTINQLKSQENIVSRLESHKKKIVELEETIMMINNKIGIIEEDLKGFMSDATQFQIETNRLQVDRFEQLTAVMNGRFVEIEKKLFKSDNAFLQSKLYKIAIGVISIIALLCSLIF
ncbi:MAG: hypothetical protein SNG38_08430 [Rikenellaceae bacterium]